MKDDSIVNNHKSYREENWDKSLPRDEAYKKYISEEKPVERSETVHGCNECSLLKEIVALLKEKKLIEGRISYNESAQAWSILRLHKTILDEFKEFKTEYS